MITQNFAYHAPTDLEGVVAALAGHDAVIVGGGTMVVPDLTHGRTSADVVVDLSRAGLSGITRAGDTVVVGATTTYTRLLRDGGEQVPPLRRIAGGITGGPQIRNRGTVGGSACYANPSSEVPAVLVALGAELRLVSAAGVREVAAADFFTGAFTTARRPDEVLAALVLPGPAGPFGYHKLKLAESSWPIATAACVRLPGGGLRLALGGVAATPLPVHLESDDPGHVRAEVGRVLTEPWSDVLADGDYRRRVAPVAALRAVRELRAVEEMRATEESRGIREPRSAQEGEPR
ncbi:FAD binding domain-containing protein [Streptosporangium sp. NPDC049078]|uniref:FAD binding domain-containing protein n=1 Tax=Streptosporangium sp. NPDC049078 TaxID=3155767 RepID=UPI00344556EE